METESVSEYLVHMRKVAGIRTTDGIDPRKKLLAEIFCMEKISHTPASLKLKYSVDEALLGIPLNCREVIMAWFGIDADRIKTSQEIAADRGVTRGRIYQIKNKAVRMLRHPKHTKWLRMFAR